MSQLGQYNAGIILAADYLLSPWILSNKNTLTAFIKADYFTHFFELPFSPPPPGGTSRRFGWGCAARFCRKPLPYFRPKMWFPYPISDLTQNLRFSPWQYSGVDEIWMNSWDKTSRVKANLRAAICRPDLSATINREANRFKYSASTANAFFIVKTSWWNVLENKMVGDN